jgi:DNA-binding response OmpR family regulator
MSDTPLTHNEDEQVAEAFADVPTEKLSYVRHELRTPINAIVGYSEMLLEDGEGEFPDALPDLERIHKAGKRLLSLVDLFLTPGRSSVATPTWKTPPVTAPAVRSSSEVETQIKRRNANLTGNLLIVDDIESNRDYLSRRLLRHGYQVGTAEQGEEALQKLQEEPFDLVLLDIMMPVMDGYETLARLKADPNLNHIPVIMLTALDELDSVVRCIEMGAEDYLPKLPNEVLLQARIGACLEKKHLRDQEIAYLRDVQFVTTAAAAVETGNFDVKVLSEVAQREDELGSLARVFERMAKEVEAREQRLRQQVQQLRIEIDQQKKEKQVSEIVDSDYFQSLQQRATQLRKKADRSS